MRGRSKNETSYAFHLSRAFAGVMQRMDYPTPAGESAYAISAVHADALGVQPHAVNYRCGKPYAHSFGCDTHPKHNAISHIDRLSRACHTYSDGHIHTSACDAWAGNQAAQL